MKLRVICSTRICENAKCTKNNEENYFTTKELEYLLCLLPTIAHSFNYCPQEEYHQQFQVNINKAKSLH